MPHPRTLINPAALGLALAVSPVVASAKAADLYFERSFMTEAGARCALFTPQVQSALVSSREQARSAALRAGSTPQSLKTMSDTARDRARSVRCDSKDLGIAAERVRSGFKEYAQLVHQEFPGDIGVWKADRSVSPKQSLWRLSQDAVQAGVRLRLGIVGRPGVENMMAVAHFPDGGKPYAARLILRDKRLTSGAFIDARGESLKTLALTRRMPKTGPFISYSAESRSVAGSDLLPPGLASGWVFRFPAEAAIAIDGLDPREAVKIEFLFPSGSSRQAYLEVGDFAAARAFLAVKPG